MNVKGYRVGLLLIGATFLTTLILSALTPGSASALQITNRSLTLVGGATDGGSKPGGSVVHKFDFTSPVGGGGSVGSVRFQYCTIASGTCTMPTGLVTTSASLSAQTAPNGAFTMVNTTNGSPYITRTAGNIPASTALSFTLGSAGNYITNPTTANSTFFVRISYYTTTNATGTPLDTGTVAASTADPVVLTGTMPESLVFCTGIRVNVSCTSTTSASNILFDDLFSPTVTRYAFSEMAASTNALSGYAITVNGATMTSGANTIVAQATAAASTVGASQFGMNLRANTSAASFTSGLAYVFPGPGTVTNSASSTAVTGTGTNFLSSIRVGEVLNFTSGTAESCTVATVTSNTALTCSANITNAHTTATYTVTTSYGANFGDNVSPASNTGTTHKGQPKAGYETVDTYQFVSGNTVAASDFGGSSGPTNSQKYTASYIVNVNPAQPAGTYSTTLTYICTATF